MKLVPVYCNPIIDKSVRIYYNFKQYSANYSHLNDRWCKLQDAYGNWEQDKYEHDYKRIVRCN